MEGELQDWEWVHRSDSDSVDDPRNFDETEDESGGMIRPDYFSIDGSSRYPRAAASDAGDSDNPSWTDPGSETRFQRKNSDEFWSDSASDLSDERKLGDLDLKGEPVAAEAAKGPAEMEAAGGCGVKSEKSAFGLGEFDLGAKDEFGFSASAKKHVDGGEIQGLGEDSPKFWSASAGEGLAAMKLGEDMSREEGLGVGNDQAAEAGGGNEAAEDESFVS